MPTNTTFSHYFTPATRGSQSKIRNLSHKMPPKAEKTMPSLTSRTNRRRRRGSGSSRVAVLSVCVLVLAIATIANGFTTTATTSMPTIVKKVQVQSNANIQQQRHPQHLPSRTSYLVLTSSNSAELEGSTVNEGSTLFPKSKENSQGLSKLSATLSKIGMITFLASMCLALPIALLPPYLLHRVGLISRVKQQSMALSNGQFCARWLLRLIPFCKVTCFSSPELETDPQPSVWVCNHSSALDVFMILASDFKMRGNKKRPIKIVYVSIQAADQSECILCRSEFLQV